MDNRVREPKKPGRKKQRKQSGCASNFVFNLGSAVSVDRGPGVTPREVIAQVFGSHFKPL